MILLPPFRFLPLPSDTAGDWALPDALVLCSARNPTSSGTTQWASAGQTAPDPLPLLEDRGA